MGIKFTFFFIFLSQTWSIQSIPNKDFERGTSSNGWTKWSDWSECSRSCDGGISQRIRNCMLSKCEGNSIEYKICNIEVCSDNFEFRDSQCSMYNEFGETEKIWKAYYHPEELCALYCVDQKDNVELLSAKVQDGTRCRLGSLDMCIDGKCQPVGCDLEIGSPKTIDNCGICGGNGKTCSVSTYQWNENTNTSCSVKCGGGYKVSQPVCQNTISNELVDQQLCDMDEMPQVKLLECNPEPCPPKWEAGEWSACSHSCGSGIKTRKVYCVEEQNKTKTKVFNHLCKGYKPRMQESCNMQPCPAEWIAGQWSQCSTLCGQGTQTRTITCNKNPINTMECDPTKKPPTEQKCIGDTCQGNYAFYDEEPKSSAVSYKESNYEIQAEKLISKQTISFHAVFVTEEWGPCNVSCGVGIRKRKVYCSARLDYTKIMTKFSDDTCSGKKPDEEEICTNKPCITESTWDSSVIRDGSGDDNREDDLSPKIAPGAAGKTYSWIKNGFTPCTATCLGGVQDLIVNCIRNEDKKVVSPYLCDMKTQPPIIMQTCNDHPCPPRWNVSEYYPCSKKCGMGIQTREVNCIHEVTMSNTVIVPHNMCEQPQPPDRQHCNIVDCLAEWHISNWTKCSKVCGGGIKTREVKCHQVTAQNHDIFHPDHICTSPKPQISRPCNTRTCNTNKKSNAEMVLSANRQMYHQSEEAKNNEISLRIGGQATVFAGTRVRIKCPVKNFPKDRIIWLKGNIELHNKGKYKISKKGILKITEITITDNTTFTCKAGQSSGSIAITVKPTTKKFPPNSEEYVKQNSQIDPVMTMEYSGKRNYDSFEDISHERFSENDKFSKNKFTKKKTPSTPSYLTSVGVTTNEILKNNEGAKHEVVDSLLPSTSSGSRLTPFLFSFFINVKSVWPFQTNSRNQQMSMEETALYEELKHMPANLTATDNIDSTAVVLGKGDRNSVKFEWLITQWSNCSPPCGGTGFQIRAAHCMVKLNNVTQHVENNLCEDAGLSVPLTLQKCETNDCPHWIVHDWQNCNFSRCFAWNTAMQKREVLCQAPNGTLVPDARCEAAEKPITKQECYNDLCKGTWRVGEWTDCYAPCDQDGIKYRILQCVWYGTKKPAGTACRNQPRPPVMRTCKGVPCDGLKDCKDLSKYCQNVKILKMCKLRRYQVQCCHSCQNE